MKLPIPTLLYGLFALGSAVQAQEVIRHAYDSGFPIAAAVEVPADSTLVYLGGTVPSVEPGAEAAADATYQQARNVLENLQQRLRDLDLGLGDIVQMQVFLVGVPEQEGRLDFEGFQRAYTEFFGTAEQPALPVRSVLQVAGLARPHWLVEIEVVAVRP